MTASRFISVIPLFRCTRSTLPRTLPHHPPPTLGIQQHYCCFCCCNISTALAIKVFVLLIDISHQRVPIDIITILNITWYYLVPISALLSSCACTQPGTKQRAVVQICEAAAAVVALPRAEQRRNRFLRFLCRFAYSCGDKRGVISQRQPINIGGLSVHFFFFPSKNGKWQVPAAHHPSLCETCCVSRLFSFTSTECSAVVDACLYRTLPAL